MCNTATGNSDPSAINDKDTHTHTHALKECSIFFYTVTYGTLKNERKKEHSILLHVSLFFLFCNFRTLPTMPFCLIDRGAGGLMPSLHLYVAHRAEISSTSDPFTRDFLNCAIPQITARRRENRPVETIDSRDSSG